MEELQFNGRSVVGFGLAADTGQQQSCSYAGPFFAGAFIGAGTLFLIQLAAGVYLTQRTAPFRKA
jgi:hypothetical protein